METYTSVQQATTHFYSELSSDISIVELIERCELLTQILMDDEKTQSSKAIYRCLGAYLDVLSKELKLSMADFIIINDESNDCNFGSGGFLFDSSDLQCEYCQAINHVLASFDCSDTLQKSLNGLLHDLMLDMSLDITSSFVTLGK